MLRPRIRTEAFPTCPLQNGFHALAWRQLKVKSRCPLRRGEERASRRAAFRTDGDTEGSGDLATLIACLRPSASAAFLLSVRFTPPPRCPPV